MVILIFIASLAAVFSSENRFEDTPFYLVPTNEIKLTQFNIIENNSLKFPVFKKEKKKEFSLSINNEQLDYYKSLSDQDKGIFLKLASLGLFQDIRDKKYMGEQYSYLYKKNGAFNLETIIIVPLTYKEAIPIITDYASYNDWVLKDVNVRRNGEKGKYFVDINSLNYRKQDSQQLFDTRITLRSGIKGDYMLDLLILDSTNEKPIPSFTLKMKEPSKLAKNVEGTFKFIILPGSPYFVVFFTGKSELSWTLYRFLPLALVRSQVMERVSTMLENIQYKAEQFKQQSK
ncbi:MAG: hypothetical protein NTY22_09115 [Proteobacteria bacterium]|nr:hypothetical protein [Pseudomonadota bacterium]